MAILEVENLKVSYYTYAGEVQSVRGISFDVECGETLAIIGESGCGKSVTARAIMQLVQKPQGEIKEGSRIVYNGTDILTMDKKKLRDYRGGECSIIFQDALVALNPTMKVGKQIEENIILHQDIDKKLVKQEVIRLLELVGIPNAERRRNQYPFQFSGGMRQRAMIAMAIAGNPKILIADEPTTALDVTIQAQIMELILELKNKLNTAVILITHDFGVVAGSADKIAVMYAGTIVEAGKCEDIFYHPKHPYTWALLNAVPKMEWKSKQLLDTIKGNPPDLIVPPKGCPFAKRCEHCMNLCLEETPEYTYFDNGHQTSCHLYHPDNQNPKVEFAYGGGNDGQ
ncbi:ABC transporter ATP-binding protein [Anaeromicropila herbilytica]|uniref:Oligopeptide/dipeptide ABC transporter ATP-binding protein n=1 Tax=Anaeromicropila herbilytica TaxID=2785025 RepID=A0A7R7IEA8_9FIRM|nr:oligopeptide/dipeptide ABC transporter ATP-binding protein [Anaeromicropila herbilytica]